VYLYCDEKLEIVSQKTFFLNSVNLNCHFFVGGVAAYSSPPPEAIGSFNSSQFDEKGWWEEQTNGLLTDGVYGNQDIKLANVPAYCKFHQT
jgi:hypothetical protein